MTHHSKNLVGLLARIGLGCLCLALASPLFAAADDDFDPLVWQRVDFLTAERAWDAGDVRRYWDLKEALADYPLYPYLEYREFKRSLDKTRPDEVKRFLATWRDTSLAERLRNRWLRLLERRGDWAAYLIFDAPSDHAWRRCNRLRALYETGRREQALAAVEPLWNVGESQPRQCDRLFEVWAEAGRMTPERIWSRFSKVMARGDMSLARHLTKRMPKADARLADVWIRLYGEPERLARKSLRQRLEKDGPRERQVLVHALARLARKDEQKAVAAWKELGSRYAFDERERASVFGAIGHYRSKRRPEAGLAWFRKIAGGSADETIRARAVRAALRARDWDAVLTWLERMEPPQRDKDHWRYWRARAHEALGDRQEANAGYETLSLKRGYYGFMAADRIDVAYALKDSPMRPSPEIRRAVKNDAGILRARELYLLGRMVDARREWRDAIGRMDENRKQAAARLADEWGWHDRAIRTAHLAGHYDDLNVRFPLTYWGVVAYQARRQQLDMAWVYGVLRQESAFAYDARSPAGAMGLMQLMPRTAREVADKGRIRLRSQRQLLAPDINIRLGAGYLRMMLNEFDAHPALATAAYNAGPHRVRKWRPKREAMPVDLWVELIPFKETRHYVRRVLAYTVIYEQRMGRRPVRLNVKLGDVYPRHWRKRERQAAVSTRTEEG